MGKLQSLDSCFLESFRKLLYDGLALGPVLAEAVDLTRGSLGVWAPENVRPFRPEDLQTDIFYPEPYNAEQDVAQDLCSLVFRDNTTALLGETDRYGRQKPSGAILDQFAWLAVPSAVPAYQDFLCACQLGSDIDERSWLELRKELRLYPSIAAVVEHPSISNFRKGTFSEVSTEKLAVILRATKFILVGVFDEVSMMLWKRDAESTKS